jgi:hypothetical protein
VSPAALAVPVRAGDRVIGALTVGRDDAYAPSERFLLGWVAQQLGHALPAGQAVPA